ncbi:hypothetical protein Nepgr_020549 [Nepenthes gracilis]|uniref:DUF7780 domain-containing protein n=1 Tax=Nepenthes gracilis TaxID=150966 RepID=A0AAD3SVH7_NEPGR|nr:hypothetical protein Nepgr_020549 [Nepenthes gracilis]
MVWSAKSKSSGGELGWGMGFLLIFFPEDEFNRKKTLSSLSSSSASAAAAAPIRSKALSTLSICALLVFSTLLLFTVSTFEPNLPRQQPPKSSRRLLLLKPSKSIPPNPAFSLFKILNHSSRTGRVAYSAAALQGMGTLYRRGTKAVSDLIVGHVSEDIEEREFRSFLRILHYIGLLSRSDLVLIFASPLSSSLLSRTVEEENESFLKLVNSYAKSNETIRGSVENNGLTRYLRTGIGEEDITQKGTIWGKGTGSTRPTRSNYSDSGKSFRLSYGSVVGFEASELDPEDSLSGFLDPVPLSMRRWACYQMLLGRVKRNFKHTMLVDVKELLILKDPFTRLRNQSPESVLLWSCPDTESVKRNRKNSVKSQQKSVSPGIIIGGGRGVRRVSSAMLTAIVRASIEHKGKSKTSVSESALLTQLVHNLYILQNVRLIMPVESIKDASSLAESGPPFSPSNYYHYSVVQRGNRNFDIDFAVNREMCSSEFYSSVYSDYCLAIQ